MGKLIKFLGAIIVLLLIAIVAIPMIIDPNDYRDEIIASVEDTTGRKLTIEGDIKLSIFPWVGVDIGKLNLGNAKGFDEKSFAAIDKASVRIKLIPLISKEVIVDTITLDGLALNLAKNKAGTTNWADLAGEPSEAKKEDSDSSSTALSALAIGGININNATIHWQDDSTGQIYDVKNFHLNSGSITPGQPVDLALGLDLSSSQPPMTATINLDGTVSIDDAIEKLTVTPLKITVKAKGEAFSGGALNADLSTNLSVNLKALAVNLNDLILNSGDLNLKGNVALNNLDKQPVIDGDLKLAKLNLGKWLSSQGISLPQMANSEALSSFETDLTLKSSGTSTEITKLNIALDDSIIKGTAKLTGAHVDFNLHLNHINVDDYLPPATKTEDQANTATFSLISEATAATATTSNDDAPLLPIELLKTLDIKGTLNADKIVAKKITSEQLTVNIAAKNGKILIDNQIAKFYDGSFDAKTNLNVTGKAPKLSIVTHLKKLNVSPLLLDLTGQDKLSGTGRFNADINATGNSINAIKSTLGGNLDFRFDNGAVKGINLAKFIRETKAKFSGTTIPTSNEPEQTDFSELSASAKITNGILNNQDFLAKSPYLRVKGAGTVNIVKETLNYTVESTIVGTSTGQGGEDLSDLKGLNIPIQLSGSYLAPSYKVDWGKVLLSSQQAKVDEKVEEKKQEIKDKVKDKVGDMFKGLF